MNRSESIKNLAEALANFNQKISSISMDGKNSFFNSSYVTLDKLIKETRPLLQEVGLSVMQFPIDKEGFVGVQTFLLHASGEFIEGNEFYLKPVKNDPQAYGSAVTYARRYSYQALLNLNTGEDDDGNHATYGEGSPSDNTKQSTLTDKQIKRLYAIACKKGKTEAQIKQSIKQKIDKESIKDLTREEYNKMIEALESLPDKK